MASVRGAALCAPAAGLLALSACGSGAVPVEQPSLTAEQRGVCAELVEGLPDTVADLERRELDPPGALGAAWGDPAIVLTCGVGKPQDYDPANGCTTVNEVDWYIPLPQLEANGGEDLTMTTIERDVAVRVVLPGELWPPATALADLAPSISEHTEARGRCL